MIKFNLKEVFWITKTAEFSETLPPCTPTRALPWTHWGGGGGGGEANSCEPPRPSPVFLKLLCPNFVSICYWCKYKLSSWTYQALTIGKHTYVYFYWHMHDFWHAHWCVHSFFPTIFKIFIILIILHCIKTYCYIFDL